MLFLQNLRIRKNKPTLIFKDNFYLQCNANSNDTFVLNNSVIIKVYNKYGYDNRVISNETEIQIEKYNIYKIFQKKKLIDFLDNTNISIYKKLNMLMLDKNEIKPFDVKSGGLMKHYNFTSLDI